MPGEHRLLVRARVPSEIAGRLRLDVDLALSDGITVVMGPSGAGKTTLLTTIAGLVTSAVGRIVLDGAVLLDSQARCMVPPHKRRVALVFQSLALFPHMRAWENVAYGLPCLPERSAARRREEALDWLARTRVAEVAQRYPAALSGGEAQRVALARALACKPRALLLDEPFSALDLGLRQQLGAELRTLVQQTGVPTVLVTHDREDAANLGSRLLVLQAGRVEAP